MDEDTAGKAYLQRRLAQAEANLTEMAEAWPDDPELMVVADRLRGEIEAEAGPNAAMVRERFTCLLGSLGLIPSDNEGRPCD